MKTKRKMIQVSLKDGARKLIGTPETSLQAYMKVIHRLNENAYEYGVLYIPLDQEFNDWAEFATEWMSGEPSANAPGRVVLIKTEPVEGISIDKPIVITTGYLCPGFGCWKYERGGRVSDNGYCVVGVQNLPQP